jgi:pimeloyl-ACP methyl ester carboxylesterase
MTALLHHELLRTAKEDRRREAERTRWFGQRAAGDGAGRPAPEPPAGSELYLERFRCTVETAYGPISLLDMGEGPVALFVHGAGTNAYLWRHVLTATAGPERRCVAVDLPLHGRSPASPRRPFGIAAFGELLEQICSELILGQVDLVANDSGGAIAQHFAATHPGRIRTLSLTNCETHDNVPPPAFRSTVRLARLGILRRTAPRLLRNPELARRRVFGSTYEDVEALPIEIAMSFMAPVLGTKDRARQFERWLTSLRAEDLLAVEPALRRLDAPTLVAWGTGDRFFETKWASWLAETLPNVTELATISRGRLFFPDERAGEFIPLLQSHWAATPRSGGNGFARSLVDQRFGG